MIIIFILLCLLWAKRRKQKRILWERLEADRFLGELQRLTRYHFFSNPNLKAEYKDFSTNDPDAALAIRLANSDRGRTRSDNHLFHNKHWEEDE